MDKVEEFKAETRVSLETAKKLCVVSFGNVNVREGNWRFRLRD